MMTIGRSLVGPDHIVRDEMHGDVAGRSCQASPYGRAIFAKAVDGCSQTDRSSWFYFGVAVISDPRLVVVQKGSVMECMRNEDGYNESEVGKPFLMQCRVWLDSPIKRLADAEIYSV